MQNYAKKTLVIITKADACDVGFRDKKILGLTSAQWIEKRLSPFFKEVATSEDGGFFDSENCVFVDWDCTLASVDMLKYDNGFVRLSARTYAFIQRTLQSEILDGLAARGVVLHDRQGLEIDATVKAERGAEIFSPNVVKGDSVIGGGSVIYPYCFLRDCTVGRNACVKSAFAEGCVIGDGCSVGPFACLRPDSRIGDNCRVGNFVEVKNSALGDGVKAAHLAYIGDADVGGGTNVGCGVIFANYDGKNKHRTRVGENCFLGSNVNLVAPLSLGEGVFAAAGTTITEDVDGGCFVIGRARQTVKKRGD